MSAAPMSGYVRNLALAAREAQALDVRVCAVLVLSHAAAGAMAASAR